MAPRNDGLDISNHQAPRDIDWAAVPVYPLMAHKATEGKGYRDPYFVNRWRQFAWRGHKYRGAYHWVRSDSPMAAQVANLTATLEAAGTTELKPGEFVQLDWETTPNIPNVTPAQIDEWLALFRARWGDRVCVYSSAWVPGFQAWRKANLDVPLWYADYRQTSGRTAATSYGACLWQWTSTARVPGISEGVDANEILLPDVLDRIASMAKPEPTPQPPVNQEDAMFVAVADHPRYPGILVVYERLPGGKYIHVNEGEATRLARWRSGTDVPTWANSQPKVAWAELAPFVAEA